MDKAKIIGHGAYIPKFRLKIDEIEKAWPDKEYSTRSRRMGVEEKAVAGFDEDEVTMAYEAGKNALERTGIEPSSLGGIMTGSMSRRFRDKSISAMVAQMLGADHVMACDCVHSSKSGTSALILGKSLAGAEEQTVLVIATDKPSVAPCDDLEPLAGAGAAAFVLGRGPGMAVLEGNYSCSREVYDIWQPVEAPHLFYDLAVSRQLFGEVTLRAVKAYMEKSGTSFPDYDHVVFSQQDGRTVLGVARALQIPEGKLAAGLLCPRIGDLYAASPLVGLAAVMDVAKKGDRILVVSYGSGGADVVALTMEAEMDGRGGGCPSVRDYLDDKVYIDYLNYLRHSHLI